MNSRGLELLDEATRALRDDPAEPPPGLSGRVMAAVRAELGRGESVPLPAPLGPASVSARAIAVVLRHAADDVPGVWARQCRVEPDPNVPNAVGIRMSLSLRYGTGPVAEVVRAVRHRMAAAMAARVGLLITRIDLELVDLWDEEQRGER